MSEIDNIENANRVEIKRYIPGYDAGSMVRTVTGPYVLHSDHLAAIAEKDAEIKRLKTTIEMFQPVWVCRNCGNANQEKFETVRYETQDGTDYDCGCMVCQSVNTDEVQDVTRDMVAERDKLREENDSLMTRIRALEGK